MGDNTSNQEVIMVLDRCQNCGDPAVVECPNCKHISYCNSCNACSFECIPNGRVKKGTHHITVRIDSELNSELDEILKKALKTNPFATKSDIIRELIKAGIEKGDI